MMGLVSPLSISAVSGEDSHTTTLTMHPARRCRPSLASSLCTNLCSISSPAGVLAAAPSQWQDNVMMMTGWYHDAKDVPATADVEDVPPAAAAAGGGAGPEVRGWVPCPGLHRRVPTIAIQVHNPAPQLHR